MKCPYCGHQNISGTDECESCSENLSSLDGVVPQSRTEKILMEDPIRELKPRETSSVDLKMSVQEAVKKMNQDKVGCVLVTQKGEVVGILTERDVVFKVLAFKKTPSEIRVESVMTPNPVTLDENATLASALNQMSIGGYRHIPILREKKPISIISARDVLNYLARLFP